MNIIDELSDNLFKLANIYIDNGCKLSDVSIKVELCLARIVIDSSNSGGYLRCALSVEDSYSTTICDTDPNDGERIKLNKDSLYRVLNVVPSLRPLLEKPDLVNDLFRLANDMILRSIEMQIERKKDFLDHFIIQES